MTPVVNEMLIDNVPVNENPLAHNKEIEEKVEIEDVEEIEQEEGVQVEVIRIRPIDLVLSQ